MEFALILLAMAVLALSGTVLYLFFFGGKGGRVRVESFGCDVESIRSVGELVALRAIYSAPAVGRESIWGTKGQKFLHWLWSESKSIMIFRFEISFKYDLRDVESVRLKRAEDNTLVVDLGKPHYDINIRDVRFYHTEQGRLLDWLLPKALGVFQSNMDDATRQQMLEAARLEATEQAEAMIENLSDEARSSAESTLLSLARGMGFRRVVLSGQRATVAAA